MRLIDADNFNNFDYDEDRGIEFDSPREAYIQGVEYVLNGIDESPTVDATAVIHGKWTHTSWRKGEEYEYKCSECKRYKIFKKKSAKLPNYCANCGAKMDVR